MIIALLVIGFLLIIIGVKTILFKPYPKESYESSQIDLNEESIASHLSKMIQCKTVSSDHFEKIDESSFIDFKELLKASYPIVYETCSFEEIKPQGLLYKWKGKTNQNPIVLMSHFDVVPADENLWDIPAFSGMIKEGYIWGRGSLDTKGTLCGIMEAASYLMEKGFVPENVIYFAFGGDEEVSGPSAPNIVEVLKQKNIKPAFVLDEGGAIVQNIFPGVAEPVAVVGIGEKGDMDVRLDITGQGGHSSAPPAHTLAGELAQAIVNIEKKPFEAYFTLPILKLIDTLGRHSSFAYRVIFANLWLFKPLLKRVFWKMGGEINAMIRTTTAVTMLSGSPAFNVMPPQVSAGINLRLLKENSPDQAVDRLKSVINNPKIQATVVSSREASPISDIDTVGWDKLKRAICKTWPDTIVSPYLMLAGSDSRHYCEISDQVFKFSAMRLTKDELKLIHGNNERISIDQLLHIVRFYIELMLVF